MRFTHKLGPLKVLNNHLSVYPTPLNLNYSWNFGSLAGIVLASQIITGILLAMHYVGHVDLAFNSVVHLMNDVPSGMILRYAHANGASLFFIVVYIHILRGVYYSSGNQPREAVWITGVVILLVMVLTAFIGYVLPWGQMSFWGATVITSLATVIPVVGKTVLSYLWGGFSVDNPTLNRFYSLHYTFPFVLAGLSIFHIAALHQYGSTNPLGVNTQTSTIPFGMYFASKDLLGLLILLFVFACLVFFYPEMLGQFYRMATLFILQFFKKHYMLESLPYYYIIKACHQQKTIILTADSYRKNIINYIFPQDKKQIHLFFVRVPRT